MHCLAYFVFVLYVCTPARNATYLFPRMLAYSALHNSFLRLTFAHLQAMLSMCLQACLRI